MTACSGTTDSIQSYYWLDRPNETKKTKKQKNKKLPHDAGYIYKKLPIVARYIDKNILSVRTHLHIYLLYLYKYTYVCEWTASFIVVGDSFSLPAMFVLISKMIINNLDPSIGYVTLLIQRWHCLQVKTLHHHVVFSRYYIHTVYLELCFH